MQCDIDLEDVTLGQGHDTLLGHGQQLCEILSRSNLGSVPVETYSRNGIWPRVNFHNRKCLAMKLILYTYKFK